jgi:hypothetical protein
MGCGPIENPVPPMGISTTIPVPTKLATQIFQASSDTKAPSQTSIPGPFATMSGPEALEKFVSSLESDDTCNLPCWLTIRPEETQFEDVQNIFLQYSSIASLKISSDRAFLRIFLPDFEHATHDVAVEINSANSGQIEKMLISASTYQDKNGPIDFQNPDFQKLWHRYFLPGVFARNGAPEKIFLDTTSISPDTATSYPFVLWIIYPQQGFLIRYEGHNFKNSDNLEICPMQSRLEIKIWDARQSSYEEFIKDDRASGITTSLGPQPIESVTDFSTNSFYEMFKSGDITTCFGTPIAIWPR